MKVNFFNCLIAIATITLFGCNNLRPDNVATNFYNYLNNGNIEKAKELAAPSAKDYIDKLASLDVFKTKGDTLPFELMEIEKPGIPQEGDNAIVNYKIGEFKSKISLVFNDRQWRVVFNKSLRELRLIEMTSEDFLLSWLNDEEIFWENYKGCRFRIKSLLFVVNIYDSGIAFNEEKMSVLLPNKSFYGPLDNILFCGKKLQRQGIKNKEEMSFPKYSFTLKKYTSLKQKQKLIKDKRTELQDRMEYDMQCSFDFEGTFSEYGSLGVVFYDCQVVVTEKCN